MNTLGASGEVVLKTPHFPTFAQQRSFLPFLFTLGGFLRSGPCPLGFFSELEKPSAILDQIIRKLGNYDPVNCNYSFFRTSLAHAKSGFTFSRPWRTNITQ